MSKQQPQKKAETPASSQPKKRGPGQPSKLNDKLKLHIRDLFLRKKSIEEIQLELGIKPKTWSAWMFRNTQNFRADLQDWRRERMFNQAESNLEEITEIDPSVSIVIGKPGKEKEVKVFNEKILKIKSDVSIYLTETLGRNTYSKKVETVDPNALQRSELDEIRKDFKNLFSNLRAKNHGRGIAKTK